MADRNGTTDDARRRGHLSGAGVGRAGRLEDGIDAGTPTDERIDAHGSEAEVDSPLVDRSRERADRSESGSIDEHVPVNSGVLLAPAILSLGYLGAGVVGPDGGGSNAVLALLLGALLLVSGYSLARLYDDARWVASRAFDWDPDPWRHLLGGAAVLVVLGAARLRAFGVAVADPVGYFGGVAVVALVLSPIVAGPAYVVQRRRRCGRL